MAEIVGSFLGPAIEVVKLVAAPIVRQFNYLCCFTSNIYSLKHEGEELDNAIRGLQGRVDRARDNVEIIVPQVDSWLTKSNDVNLLKTRILDQVPNVESGCLKLRARFSLSKRAKKITDRMKELQGQCKFDAISQPRPPAATQETPLGNTYEFESRKKIEEDVMTTLRRRHHGNATRYKNMNMIGIYGMGGLGKTTMAKRIMNRALEEQIFQEVVMVVVSQQVDKSKIQVEIGESLGLKLGKETSHAARVQKLHARLNGTKRILLVFDDIWQRLELADLGIPCDSNGCSILLTSRDSDALSATGCSFENKFRMEVLSEEEAWFLFREGAGICVDDNKLNSIAKEVVKECRGLTIALKTVGLALKDKNNASIWKDALRDLVKCDPDIPHFIKEVYNPLKLSYDFLSSKSAKSIFLLCCLYPEDKDISLEYLTYFCVGLGIFKGHLNDARDKMFALSGMLKSRSLLLDGEKRDHVRMHDVVRDVCIWITKQDGYVGCSDCTWFSSCQLVGERNEPRTSLEFSNLSLLFLNGDYESQEEEFKLDSAFLVGIKDLYVLSIDRYSLTSLPHTTQPLRNLKTLIIGSCYSLETISVVGELVNLEIFICRYCAKVKDLPSEMKRLNRLKLLELTGCKKLQNIGRHIISSLTRLEELKMFDSFNKWEADDREEKENAGIGELEALTNLACLEIDIEDHALVSEKLQLSSKLNKFKIRLAAHYYYLPFDFDSHRFEKRMSLELEEEARLGHWIEIQLLRDTECLHLCGNGANNVDLAKSQNIRWLTLQICETMKNIVTSSYDGSAVFTSIEYLNLNCLPKLEEIWDGTISSTSFQNLKELEMKNLPLLKQLWKSSQSTYVPHFTNLSSIDIRNCPCLRNLDELSIAGKDWLPQIEKLRIEDCEMMEEVFLWNGNESDGHIFAKLKELSLYSLPNLTTFCRGVKGIEFPLLTNMNIVGCPKMKSVGGSSSTTQVVDDYSHHFCQIEKVSFGNLKELMIDRNPFCNHNISLSLFRGLEVLIIQKNKGNSMGLLSFSLAKNLFNLRRLVICNCDEMVKVIEDEQVASSSTTHPGERTLLFPKLEQLILEALPKLVSFCEWRCDVEWPFLREVTIMSCPNMKILGVGLISAPNLKVLKTDLNNYLQVIVNVSVDHLKELTIYGTENPLYHHKICLSLFNGLEILSINSYGGSKGFITGSIAGNLVSLRELYIEYCVEVVKVFEEDEEEVVSSATAQPQSTLVFPKLQRLHLSNLFKLVSFCDLRCDVVLPSLREVSIWMCSNMKMFTLGPLTVPVTFKNLKIDYANLGAPKDFNGALQQCYLARAKEKQEAEKEGDQEKEGEIEKGHN